MVTHHVLILNIGIATSCIAAPYCQEHTNYVHIEHSLLSIITPLKNSAQYTGAYVSYTIDDIILY